MAKFCTITRVLSAAHLDSWDADTDPDIHPVQGEVTFTPIIPEGEAIQLYENNKPRTIVPLPITVRISDGEIFHRGETSVKLLAGGDRMNPPKLYWRASFAHMQSNGIPFKLKPIQFEAIPDGTVDLTAVAPVVGIEPPTIKGRDGDIVTGLKTEGANLIVTVRDADGVVKKHQIAIGQVATTVAADAVTRAEKAASAAGVSQQKAATSESNSAGSATQAKAAEIAAGSSKNAAATSASNAKISETNAAGSASAAATSASATKTSETNTKISENNALASKNAAATSASNAKVSETNAANSAAQAANIANSTSWSGDKLTVNGKTSPSLTGPMGPRGPQGDRGLTGDRGPQGGKGDTGPQGEVTRAQMTTAISEAIVALAPTGLKLVLAAPNDTVAAAADTAINAKGYSAVVVVPSTGNWFGTL